MQYLIKTSADGKPLGAAHVWVNGDTQCRMHSSGGLHETKRKRAVIYGDARGRPVCQLCQKHEAKVPHGVGPAVMPFGKYEGWAMSRLPDDYLRWASTNLRNAPNCVHDELSRRWEASSAKTAPLP